MYAITDNSLGIAVRSRKSLRGMGEQASYITPSGARIVYDTSSPPPGVSASSASSYLPPVAQTPATNYPDGTYVQKPDGGVGVVKGGFLWGINGGPVGDALGGGYKNAIQISAAQWNAIPRAGDYSLQNHNIVITDPSGNILTVEPITQATPTTATSGSGLYWDGSQWRTPPSAQVYSTAAQTSLVPTTSLAAVAAPVTSAVSSLTSALPSWWPYAAIAVGGWLLLSGKKGRR